MFQYTLQEIVFKEKIKAKDTNNTPISFDIIIGQKQKLRVITVKE